MGISYVVCLVQEDHSYEEGKVSVETVKFDYVCCISSVYQVLLSVGHPVFYQYQVLSSVGHPFLLVPSSVECWSPFYIGTKFCQVSVILFCRYQVLMSVGHPVLLQPSCQVLVILFYHYRVLSSLGHCISLVPRSVKCQSSCHYCYQVLRVCWTF